MGFGSIGIFFGNKECYQEFSCRVGTALLQIVIVLLLNCQKPSKSSLSSILLFFGVFFN